MSGLSQDSDSGGLDLAAAVAVDACSALGLFDDRQTHLLMPFPGHRCFAEPLVRKVPIDHQIAFCLTTQHELCPLWQRAGIGAQTPGAPVERRRHLGSAVLRPPRRRLRISFWLPRVSRSRVPASPENPGASWPAWRRHLLVTIVAVLAVLVMAAGVAVAIVRPFSHSDLASLVAAEPKVAPADNTTATLASIATGPALPKASDLTTEQLVRPGAELIKRLDASLDGSVTGNVVVASRIPSPGGCDRLFLDVFAFDKSAGRFVDVFDGNGLSNAAGPLLPPPTRTDQGCQPQLAVLDTASFDGGSVRLVVAGITLADGRLRVVALGPGQQSGRAQVVYDVTTGPGGSARLLDSPKRLEITEDAFAPATPGVADAGLGPVGTFRQVFGGTGETLTVVSRSFLPSCYSGTIAAKAVINSERWLRVHCTGLSGTRGSDTVYVVAAGAAVQPPAATLESIFIGDEVAVTVDGTVRPPGDARSSVAVASGLQLIGSAAARFATPAPAPR